MKNETVFTEFTLKFLMEEEISHQFSKGLLICELQICGAEVTKFSNRAGIIFGPRNFNVGGTLKNKLLSFFHINQPEYVNPKSTAEENQSALKLLLKTFILG